MRRLFLYSVIILTLSTAKAQQIPVDHWEIMVDASQVWHYFRGTEEPPAAWKNIGFDDNLWSEGPGGIGYGDGDDSTEIDPVGSVYMRKMFAVTDPQQLAGALFYIDYDDGFVAYLNGLEIARGNMGSSGWIPPYNAYADNDTHEAQLYQGGVPEQFPVFKPLLDSLLVAGENVLAIQVHNCNATSSDLSSIPYLFAASTDTTGNTPELPEWFVPYDFDFTSHLPIMSINTNGQAILNDPRIVADLKVYDNPDGEPNSRSNLPNGYDGRISIEIRGNSSQMFDKKSYAFETQNENGENNNAELLGLPPENDWILYGPYSDKSLIRDVLVMQLACEMGWYASRTKFCELFINDDYRGLYILMEKIKRDSKRVDINETDANDNAGDSLTGGYIVKVDWPDDGSTYDWHSPVNYFNGYYLDLNYQYEYPDREDITGYQETYIQDFVSDFELALIGNNYKDLANGYRKYIDVHSFADYFILNEIANNVDAYRLSNFFTKVAGSKGGKLFEGPVWDFNLGFGNANYGNAWLTSGWALYNPDVTAVIPFHLKRLRQDPAFTGLVYCRWNGLRTNLLSDEHINVLIDSLTTYLGPAIDRNFERWDILGTYVWPNYFVGDTYEEEIGFLKDFIEGRLNWMDNNITGNPEACQSAYLDKIIITEIRYQPADHFEVGDWFEIYNNSPETITLTGWVAKDENNLNTYTFPAGTLIYPGQYLVVCSDLAQFTNVFSNVYNRLGSFTWMLGQKDRIRIYDENGKMVCDVRYQDNGDWPSLPAGQGQTLELTDIGADPNDPASWFGGCPGGSPGTAYMLPCPELRVAEEQLRSFSIYPNPAKDVLNIRFGSKKKASIGIMTVEGKSVKNLVTNTDYVQVNITGLCEGFYVVRIVTSDACLTQPFMIERE